MAFEVGQHQHGVIIQDMFADGQFRKPFPAGNGKAYVPVLIHDVDGAEGPAVGPQGFTMPFRGLPRTGIQNIAFHNAAVRNIRLESPDHFAGQNIRTMRFARMQLDGDLAAHAMIDAGIDLHQPFEADVLREKDLGLFLRRGHSSIDPGEAPKSEGPYSERSALQKTPAGKLFSHIMNSLIASPQ